MVICKVKFYLNLMKKLVTIFLTLFVASSVWAQTNYTVTFSANVEMEKVQVTNTVSGETKTLYMPDNVITLQKNKQQETAVETVDNSAFLQQTGENTVVVNMEKAGHVNLTLYSLNGTFVARYSNNVDAGPNAFKIGAASGVYVLVASANNQSASLKLSLTQNSQPSILEILTTKPEALLKSVDDVITFDEGDQFEFIGYYKNQTDVKTAVITRSLKISFTLNTEPSVNTTQPVDVLYTTATVGGNVTKDNGAAVTERGVCWATTDNPTISDNKEICGDGVGAFTISLTELADATTYYVRAYAINEVGITYGETNSFTTQTISVPTVSSAHIVDVSESSVTLEGTIVDDNGATVIERGVCWATTENPTVSDNKVVADNETTSFSLSITGLEKGTIYYVRTYAVNSIGIAYGETVSFTTTDIPVVATAIAKHVLYTTATIEGSVTSDNGAIVTERGVCWSTAENPTVDDNKISKDAGTGSFSVSLTELSEETMYYVRAYAINSVGIAYGDQISFVTIKNPIVNGAIRAEFSVSNTKKVYFSQGNLQYNAKTDTWRFAENQSDMIGKNNSKISSSYDGWIDLFGWGTSGYNKKYPYMTTKTSSNYGDGKKNDIAGTNYDWGVYNKISNGGNQAGMWRTLTQSEWYYLMNRTNSNNEKLCYVAAIRAADGEWWSACGLILLPDYWTDELTYQLGGVYTAGTDRDYGYVPKSILYVSATNWEVMQAHGAVFLPQAGYRNGTSVKEIDSEIGAGYYWSSSAVLDYDLDCKIQRFHIEPVNQKFYKEIAQGHIARCMGCSVRLVQDVK